MSGVGEWDEIDDVLDGASNDDFEADADDGLEDEGTSAGWTPAPAASGQDDAMTTALTAALAGDALRQGVAEAVTRAVGARLDALAREAVKGALTDDVLDELREAAEHAVEDELTGRGSTQGTGKGEAEPQLQYDSVVDFVTDFLAPTYGRALSSSRIWCPQWWSHAEALYRLDALWRSWEHLRMDAATGSSVWLRDHADHHMAVLMSDSGPFKGCSPEKGHRQRDPDNDWSTLPLAPPPPELFG